MYLAAFYTSKIAAQSLDNQILTDFSHGVSAQVFDIVVKTKVTVDAGKQYEIAKVIEEKEEAMFLLLQANATDSAVVATKINYEDQINDLLDTEQKFNRYVSSSKENAKNKYSYTQFSAGIRYKDSLELVPAQIALLMNYVDSVKLMKNQHYAQFQKSLDTRAYESKKIQTILGSNQYLNLLKYKNKKRAAKNAESDWKELELRHADSTFAKDQAILDLTNYYLVKAYIYDKYQGDVIKQKAELRELYNHRPRIVRLLEKARRNPDNDTAIKLYKW